VGYIHPVLVAEAQSYEARGDTGNIRSTVAGVGMGSIGDTARQGGRPAVLVRRLVQERGHSQGAEHVTDPPQEDIR
jgi:hypothetical protein